MNFITYHACIQQTTWHADSLQTIRSRTLRDGVGGLVDTFASVLANYDDSGVRSKAQLLYLFKRRLDVLPFDRQIEDAYDDYLFVRDSYLQNRLFLIFDGKRLRHHFGDPPPRKA